MIERQWIYDGQLRPVAELNSAGTVTATYIYATHINIPDYIIKSGITYRVITDHLGSLRFVINSSNGSIAQRIDYDDWGNVLLNTNPDFTPFGFAGGIYDKDTKLVRFGARDYDAEVGRWTTKDPVGFKGLQPNLYCYALGDPINLQDPTGLRGCVAECIVKTRSSLHAYKRFQWPLTIASALGGFSLGFTAGANTLAGNFILGGIGAAGGALGGYYGIEWGAAILGEKRGLRNCLQCCIGDSPGLKPEMIDQLTEDIYDMLWKEKVFIH